MAANTSTSTDMACNPPAPSALADRYVMRMVMQPIMSLSHPFETLNFEMLLRVNELQSGKSTPPDMLVAEAEKNGSVGSIDRWVLRSSLQWLDKHAAELQNTQFATVNVSAASFNDPVFHDELLKQIDSFSSPTRLCIEITESVALADFEFARGAIRDLRLRGVRVAIDDFGAGHASFTYLRELSVDAIKIDGALVKSIGSDRKCAHIVSSLCAVAKALGIKVIAEWAEDKETIEALRVMGADYVQGYAISAAREPDEILGAGTLGNLLLP